MVVIGTVVEKGDGGMKGGKGRWKEGLGFAIRRNCA
jgi:hypothetical protein